MGNQNKPIPDYLFKFKAISSVQDIERVLDIVENNRIYVPKYDQFNDPWEGSSLDSYPHCCGGSIPRAIGKRHPIDDEIMKSFRILCLTSAITNPPMWAHYANSNSGICLVFKTDPSFMEVRQVEYTDKLISSLGGNDREIASREMKQAFYCKHPHWGYEEEWRLILPSGEEYFAFDSNSLQGIVFGSECPSLVSALIADKCKSFGIVPYSSAPILTSYEIAVFPFGRRLDFDGSSWRKQVDEMFEGDMPPFIST